MGRAQARCGGISCSEQGTGFPLVLLHASLCDRRDVDPIIPDLAEWHRVIAVDWPWHEESGSPQPPLKAGAGLFAGVLALALPPAAFIGSSAGGFAAARLAITHPERVARLVLVDGGGFIPVSLLTRAFCSLMGIPALTRVLMPSFIRLTMSPATGGDREVVRRVAARARTAGGMRTGAALGRSFARPEHDLRPRAAQLRADADRLDSQRHRHATACRARHSRRNRKFPPGGPGHRPHAVLVGSPGLLVAGNAIH